MLPKPPLNPPPPPKIPPPGQRRVPNRIMSRLVGPSRMTIPKPPPPSIPRLSSQLLSKYQGQGPPLSRVPLPPKLPLQSSFNNMMGLGKRPLPPKGPIMQMRPNKRMKLSKIDEKVKNAKQSAKIKFTLGSKAKSNLMEDYLEEALVYNSFFPFYTRNLDSNLAKETRMRIKDMKTNPQNYFNFGRFFLFLTQDLILMTTRLISRNIIL